MSVEERIPGEIYSWIIISRREMSGEICLGDIFPGENCESLIFMLTLVLNVLEKVPGGP